MIFNFGWIVEVFHTFSTYGIDTEVIIHFYNSIICINMCCTIYTNYSVSVFILGKILFLPFLTFPEFILTTKQNKIILFFSLYFSKYELIESKMFCAVPPCSEKFKFSSYIWSKVVLNVQNLSNCRSLGELNCLQICQFLQNVAASFRFVMF